MPDGPWPASGAVLAAVEAAAGVSATRVIGKPEGAMYEVVRDRLGEGRCLAVGDRLDYRHRRRAAAPAWTRRSCSRASPRAPQADAADPRPTYVADSLGALVLGQ